MEELKTLKDFKKDYCIKCSQQGNVNAFMLRLEAIKWIKALIQCPCGINPCPNLNTATWIKHFFNISDKELEEEIA